MHDCDGHARRMSVLEDFLQLLLEFRNRLRGLWRLLFLIFGATGNHEHAEKKEASDGFHDLHFALERTSYANRKTSMGIPAKGSGFAR